MFLRISILLALITLSYQSSVKAQKDCYLEKATNYYTCKYHVGNTDGLHLDGKSDQDVKKLVFSKGAAEFPSEIFAKFPNVEILKAHACGLTKFNADVLKGASKLKEIDLSNNELHVLSANMFANAPNLVYLDLSRNGLTDIPEHAFGGLSSLIYLDLSNNQLETITSTYFADIPFVKVIELGNNKIKSLAKDIFINNLSLRSVRFSRNQISKIDPELFKLIPRRCKLQLWKNICIHNGYTPSRGATVGTNEEFFDNIDKNCK